MCCTGKAMSIGRRIRKRSCILGGAHQTGSLSIVRQIVRQNRRTIFGPHAAEWV